MRRRGLCIYAIVSRLPDDSPKIGRNMSQYKMRIKAHRDGHADCSSLSVYLHISNLELLYGFWWKLLKPFEVEDHA